MESNRAMEIKVGAFALGSLALLLGFFLVVGNPTFGPGIRLKLDYAFSGPVKSGAAVRISGVSVGKVERVEFLGNRPVDAAVDSPVVRLHVFVEQRAQPLLTAGARFYVTTLGILGEHYVDIVPGRAGAPPLADGDVVRGVDLPRTDLLMARMANLMEQVAGVLDDNEVRLAELLSSAVKLMKRLDTTLEDTDLGAFLVDARTTLSEAKTVLGATRRIMDDPKAIAAMVKDGQVMMEDGRKVLGDLKTTAPELMQRANQTLAATQAVVPRVDAILRALEKSGYTDERRMGDLLKRGEQVMERMDQMSTRADGLLARIEKGEGSVGQLIHDDDVYQDLKSLLRDLRENPWRLVVPERPRK